MKYLIDNDWIIDPRKGEERVAKKLEELATEGVAVSAISLAEVYEGVYYSRDPVKSQELFKAFLAPDLRILNVDGLVKSPFSPLFVIPAKVPRLAGFFQ